MERYIFDKAEHKNGEMKTQNKTYQHSIYINIADIVNKFL